jgi:hypothetical protein
MKTKQPETQAVFVCGGDRNCTGVQKIRGRASTSVANSLVSPPIALTGEVCRRLTDAFFDLRYRCEQCRTL